MNERRFQGALIAAVLTLSATGIAVAQTTSYNSPPKLVKAGTNTTPISGPGIVVVQVYVNADGTFKVTRIIRSTNKGDDAAAMEIARSSKYAPAKSGAKPVAQFYDYTLKFTNGSVASTPSTGGLGAYEADISAKKFAQAKAGLTSYLAEHPDDAKANTLLGVSNYFLNDYSGAVAAFNKAGSLPSLYHGVAANAYAKAAESALADKDAATAVADATKASELSPGAATENLLGTAQLQAGSYDSAVRALEQARSAAADSKLDEKQRAVIDTNLITAYVDAGQFDKAIALLPEVKQLDPSNQNAALRVEAAYDAKAEAAQKAGDFASAAALWDKAGALGGPDAAIMYTKESAAFMQGTKPNWSAATAAAEKALAIKPDDAGANFAAGVALANEGKKADAITHLQKADASAKAAGDTTVSSRAEQFLKQLGVSK